MSALKNSFFAKAYRRYIPEPVRRARWQLYGYLAERMLLRPVTRGVGYIIQDGPFKNMKYVRRSAGSLLIPKLLGSYELELRDICEEIVRSCPQRIVDIGCAEGYYAVGFAYRCDQVNVIACDTDARARRLCGRLASMNRVQNRVTILGECTSQRLESVISKGTVVICDCEGEEINILDLRSAPTLADCTILVELHDLKNDQITPTILSRFRATHEVLLVDSAPRDSDQFQRLDNLSDRRKAAALNERLGFQQWAYMTPKARREGRLSG